MLIAGFHSGHESSYAILRDGVPILHAELERYIREKEPFGDGLELLFKDFEYHEDIKHFTHTLCTWKGGIQQRHPQTYKKMYDIINKNDGDFHVPGHHEAHAAAAFFSSNLDDALIITIDGGGREFFNNDVITCTMTAYEGRGNKIVSKVQFSDLSVNIGAFWSTMTRDIFGLSVGHPKGHQAGTVMAMAAFGDEHRFGPMFVQDHKTFWVTPEQVKKYQDIVSSDKDPEQTKFDMAAGMQYATETALHFVIGNILREYPNRNLCLSGGVSLNSVLVGKMLDWFKLDNIYVDPVPYDGGLAIGAAQWVYYQVLNYPRIYIEDNYSPYLGKKYNGEAIKAVLESEEWRDKVKYEVALDDHVLQLLNVQKIISVYGGGSESGRRALGNRSILCDPRSPLMKDLINEKVKHRQWFRPFAPSILREEVSSWFTKDVSSPYMSFVLHWKDSVKDKVPAVVHEDGTARLQTVTEKDNFWYYNFIKQWHKKSGVPILLNTSFNDSEPIVETPHDAVHCFVGTNIDYLYFYEYGILVSKK